jgi:DNA invertase Pin-like site-specific DNA recombinase
MKVALYARYSSENQRESSIDDQFRNCKERAAREGWTVTAHYKDKAISGSTTERPGYQQMLKDAKAKQFDILLVDSFSRLSRDSMESEQTRRRFVHWGVRLIGVSDGVDTAIEGHEIQSGVQGIMNARFLKDLSKNIKRGMIGQAAKCYWQGNRIYGYRLVRECHPTKRDQYGEPLRIGTTLEIHPEQAEVVRQIFQLYADGLSPLKIADDLNRRGIPAPRPSGWHAASLHGYLVRGTGMLNNPIYVGRYRWNRSRREKDPDTGYATHIMRPSSEWVETAAPHLRIIDDALWQQVQARRRAVSAGVHSLRGLHGRARSTGACPKYLLSGLLVCSECEEKFVISNRTNYGCATHRSRGASVCANGLLLPCQLVEARVLQAIKDDLFTQEGLEVFTQEVTRLLAAQRRTRTPDLKQAHAKLGDVEKVITNILDAIKQGILTTSTKEALEQAEAERAQLLRVIQAGHKPIDKVSCFLPDIVGKFKALVDDLATVTQHQVDKARGMLKQLVGGQIVLHPSSDGTDRFLTAELSGDYAGLVRLVCGPKLNLATVGRRMSIGDLAPGLTSSPRSS